MLSFRRVSAQKFLATQNPMGLCQSGLGPQSLSLPILRSKPDRRPGGILEGVVEHFFLVPPCALGAIEVGVVRFAFWIDFHFKCSDPVPDAAINDPTRHTPKPT